MTQETKIIFDLSDLTHIRVQCSSSLCQKEISFEFDSGHLIPKHCPYCGEAWVNSSWSTAKTFLVSVRELVGQTKSVFGIRLEIKGETSKK